MNINQASFTHDGCPATVKFDIDIQDQSDALAISHSVQIGDYTDEDGAQRFARILSELPSLNYKELLSLLPNEPLPDGFEHCRAFNATTGDRFSMSSRRGEKGRRIMLHDILFGVLNSPFMEVLSWTKTSKRENTLSGFLDFEMTIETVERLVMPCWKK